MISRLNFGSFYYLGMQELDAKGESGNNGSNPNA
jgi:hypothetical protein